MVAVKSGNADAFLAKPDRLPDVVLIFGEDSGLVSERVRTLIGASVDNPDDPFSLVRLDGDEIAADPARLLDETQTIPLFGGRRAVWVRAGGRNFAPAVEAVLALPKSECRVVIEAGDLRRTAPLRAVCERAKNAAAVPCYADNEAALERLIDGEMRAAGLSLKPEARALLVTLLGGDRAGSRSEIRKLVLYAHGSPLAQPKPKLMWSLSSIARNSDSVRRPNWRMLMPFWFSVELPLLFVVLPMEPQLLANSASKRNLS